jgi:hypothetical protein
MRKIIFLMLCLPGSLYFPAFCFAQAGQNNIFVSPRLPDSIMLTQPIIQNEDGIPVVQIRSIDSNYFGGRNPASGPGFTPGCSVSPCTNGCGADPSKWNPSDTGEIDALYIDYCATPGGTTTSGIIPRPFFEHQYRRDRLI